MADVTETPEPARILKPYTPDFNTPGRKLRRRLGLGFLFVFCWFWGLAFAFMAPFLLLFFAFPLGVLMALCIWALPEETPAPLKALNWFFFAYLVGKIIWPDYLAVDLKVLPWITIARLTALPLTLLFLISLSVSRPFRNDIALVLKQSTLVVGLLACFNVIQFLTLPLSKSIAFSVDHLYNAEIAWTVMFFVSCWFFAKPEKAERWIRIFWILTIPVAVIATLETLRGKILWAGHIPSFLKIEDPAVQYMLAGVTRAYTGRYRAISTFTTPLGLAEYFAIAAPFVLHVVMSDEFSRRLRVVAIGTIPLIMLGVWLTNARVGSIGFLMGLVVYGLVWSLHQRRFRPNNTFASLLTLSYPVLFLGLMAATVLIGRLRRVVWGGGETANSTESRKAQLEAAIPLVAKNPIGHGVGMAAQTLGFRLPSGLLTIDSYYLSIVLEYGVLGFLIYYGMFVWGAGRAIRVGMAQPPEKRELSLLIPAGVSLFVYVLTKSVFSEEGNNSLGFILLGLTCALIYRAKAEAPAPARAAEAENEPAMFAQRPAVQGVGVNGAGPRRPRRPAIQPASP